MAGRRDPLMALYLGFLVTLPFSHPSITVGGSWAQPSDAFLVGAYALTGVRLVRRRMPLRVDGLLLASLGFIGVLALSLLFSPDRSSAHALKLGAFAALVLLPWLTRQILTDEARLASAVRAWLVGGAIVVLIGVVEIVAFYADRHGLGARLMCGYGGIPAGPYPRLCAPFRIYNMLANFLVVQVALLLACGPLLLRRPVLLGSTAVLGVVMAFTLSAGIGGFAIAAAIVVAGRRLAGRHRLRLRERALVGAAGVVAILAALSMIGSPVPKGEGEIPLGARDFGLLAGSRPPIWVGAVRTIARHPILGVGYGSLVSTTTDPRASLPYTEAERTTGPLPPVHLEGHDVWLDVAGQAGVVGLAAFVIVLVAITRGLGRTVSIAAPVEAGRPGRAALAGGIRSALRLGLAAAFVGAFLFHGLFSAIEEYRHLWALFGLMAATTPVVERPRGAASPGATA